jgi:hypothetical protein
MMKIKAAMKIKKNLTKGAEEQMKHREESNTTKPTKWTFNNNFQC